MPPLGALALPFLHIHISVSPSLCLFQTGASRLRFEPSFCRASSYLLVGQSIPWTSSRDTGEAKIPPLGFTPLRLPGTRSPAPQSGQMYYDQSQNVSLALFIVLPLPIGPISCRGPLKPLAASARACAAMVSQQEPVRTRNLPLSLLYSPCLSLLPRCSARPFPSVAACTSRPLALCS